MELPNRQNNALELPDATSVKIDIELSMPTGASDGSTAIILIMDL